MSETWTWTYDGESGEPVAAEVATDAGFPSQADAEAWLSESWQELSDEGVTAVTLWCDGTVVYGPMSLAAG